MSVLRVAVPVPLLQIFDYLPPPGSAGDLPSPGCRIAVPFGRGRRIGILVDVADHSELPRDRLKPALAVLDAQPLLTAELLDTLRWTARYYQHPLGEVLQAALPVSLRHGAEAAAGGERALALTAGATAAPPRPGTRTARLFELLGAGPLIAARLDAELPGWRSAAASLKRRGLAHTVRLRASEELRARVAGPVPTPAQQQAIEAICGDCGRFSAFLLEGITGSGKTEVYLGAIERVIAAGRQALVLVPEIGLTPQALRRFRDRLPGRIAVLHSGLAEGERTRAWLRGRARRSRRDSRHALGRSSRRCRGRARRRRRRTRRVVQAAGRIALLRARSGAGPRQGAAGFRCVLGSATPSLETLANVEAGRYRRLHLDARPGAARLPAISLHRPARQTAARRPGRGARSRQCAPASTAASRR